MNGNESSSDESPLEIADSVGTERQGHQVSHGASRLLVCNPFCPASTALLLFGINRPSVDPHFLGNEEEAKPLFDLSALQIYGILLCGALVTAMALGFVFEQPLFNVSVEAGTVFLLIHSLGWQDEKQIGASSLRAITVVTWIVHAVAWTHGDGAVAGWVVSSAAVMVLAASGVARLVTGRNGALIVPAGAVISFLAAPVNFGIEKVKASPAGLLAIIGSFVLLGLGTVLALMKDRWRYSTAVNIDKHN